MALVDIFKRKKEVNNELAAGNTVGNPLHDIESTTEFGGTRTSISGLSTGDSLPRKARRELGLDERDLAGTDVAELMDRFIDAHPDVSYALWNFLRIGNTEYDVKVHALGTGEPDDAGEEVLKELLQRLELPSVEQFEMSRSISKVANQLMLATVTRGAAALELVLTPGNDNVAFFAPVDPATVEFKYEQDRFIPYQDQGKVSLDMPTFLYEGLDPLIDNPYGRGPLISALNMIMFQLQILNDLKVVVHNQGYPRLDITIVEEVLLKRMPISIRNNEKEKSKWLNQKLSEIVTMYNGLEPDDTFVHFDSLKLDSVGGGKGGGAMFDPEKLFAVIDNLLMSGLKTLSTILGRRSQGNTESFAKIEIKLYMKSVGAIQEVVERILSRALTLALNIQGKQGYVKFKYRPVEIRTELEKAQFEQIHLMNIAYKRDQGWIDQDEAANLAVGHNSVAEPNLELLGKGGSTVTNKDGAPATGAKDEKTDENKNSSDE